MAPIPGSGGGTPLNNIVPLRGTAAPTPLRASSLPPLRASSGVRRLPTARPVGKGKRTGGAGNDGSLHAERSQQLDDTPIDNSYLLFARTRADKSADSITISERMQSWISHKMQNGLLKAWPKNVADLFSWSAQSVKSFVYTRGLGKGLLEVSGAGFYASV